MPSRDDKASETLLAPKSVRGLSAFTADVGFTIPRNDQKGFDRALSLAGIDPSTFVSPREDRETAILVHRLTARGVGYHALLEFRRGRGSPYKKVSLRRILKVLSLIDQRGERLRLNWWTQTLTVPREVFVKHAPTLVPVLTTPTGLALSGRAASVTGFHLSVSPAEGSQRPPVRVGLNWTDKTVTLILSVSGGPITYFGAAFQMGPQLVSELAPSAQDESRINDVLEKKDIAGS